MACEAGDAYAPLGDDSMSARSTAYGMFEEMANVDESGLGGESDIMIASESGSKILYVYQDIAFVTLHRATWGILPPKGFVRPLVTVAGFPAARAMLWRRRVIIVGFFWSLMAWGLHLTFATRGQRLRELFDDYLVTLSMYWASHEHVSEAISPLVAREHSFSYSNLAVACIRVLGILVVILFHQSCEAKGARIFDVCTMVTLPFALVCFVVGHGLVCSMGARLGY